MMRLLLPVLLLLFGIGGGVGAGILLTPRAETPDQGDGHDAAAHETEEDTHAPGPGESAATASGTEYVRLNNQFVVPIVRGGSVRSLVVMALTLEVDAGGNGVVFNQEPRLRDAFLRVMFAHANAGGFDGSFTQAAAMDPLREALGEAALRILGEMVHDVLIVDITRQDA